MAVRPIFCVDSNKYVRVDEVEFEYFNGFAKSQHQKSMRSLHEAFQKRNPDASVLEISRYSDTSLGTALSAFNLLISLKDGKRIPVECAFQASKVFESGGPYEDLLDALPKNAKRDPRLKESGHVISFRFEGREFSTHPKTLFYTWLYLHALSENSELTKELVRYDAFSDIAFNPQRSINCQAYSAAVYVSLYRNMEIQVALSDIDFLSEILK